MQANDPDQFEDTRDQHQYPDRFTFKPEDLGQAMNEFGAVTKSQAVHQEANPKLERSFAEEVEKENSIIEFRAHKRDTGRESRQSKGSLGQFSPPIGIEESKPRNSNGN